MHYYNFMYEEDALMGLISGIAGIFQIPSFLLNLAVYVLTALALYELCKRRGINKPWLAWIPVVNCWLLGSLSDQYQYVVKGQNKSKRKSLLTLSIINLVLGFTIAVLAVVLVAQIFIGAADGVSEAKLLEMILGPGVGILGLLVPVLGVSIAYIIIRYMALYDVYKSMDPSNCVLFLVLSILAGITEPFFLFFNRSKDLGMPPRKQTPGYTAEPVHIPAQPENDPWENKDYL